MKHHTLVMHLRPDLEVLVMGAIIFDKSEVREALDVVDDPVLKFVPAGLLRQEDWPHIAAEDLHAEYLEAKGYLFMDCGGGFLDQHGKLAELDEHGQNRLASIDLLVHESDLFSYADHLAPVVKIISDNDLYGTEIVKDGGLGDPTQSTSPNTARHLRNIVIGWNMLLDDRPGDVLKLTTLAFKAIEGMVIGAIELKVKKGCPRDEAIRTLNVRKFFMKKRICEQMQRMTPDEDLASWFEGWAQRALDRLEEEWFTAIDDYWTCGKITKVGIVQVREGQRYGSDAVLAIGHSDSSRFGQVTRFGGDDPRHVRGGHAGYRDKADVTVQLYGGGKFLVSSTNRIKLHQVAALLRQADLRKRGITVENLGLLSQPGHVSVKDADGNAVQTLFFAEYETAVGTAFRANPHAQPTVLTDEEIGKLVVKGLRTA